MSEHTAIDRDKLKAFVFDEILPSTSGAMSIIMAVIGDRLGLFKAMQGYGPINAATLSRLTDTHERYIQEWLSALAAAKWIAYDPETEEFELTPEQAMVFVEPNSLMNLQGLFGIVSACHLDLKKTIAAFQSGDGIAWEARENCLFCSMETSLGPKYHNQLISEWLPTLTGVVPKLQAGAKVADVGCGNGVTTLLMAKAFPNSEFYGFDFHAQSIEEATKNALAQGITNLSFQVGSAKDFPGQDYDLICYFDCLHDLGDPVGACQHAQKALGEGGCLMLVEPTAQDHLDENMNDVSAISYAMSTCICVPTSLSQETGLALGAQAGPARLQQVTEAAGFRDFTVVHKTLSHMIIQVV